jgi:pyruvate formate lyase activating enzyme
MHGRVFAIERGSLHDGPGIRTTVFLKGCPLRCLWCHNPESHDSEPILYSLYERCMRCGTCVSVCPNECHIRSADGRIVIDRSACVVCGTCVAECPVEALEVRGTSMEVDEVLTEVDKDWAYYVNSGGGMTVSGGEPLAQWKFTAALLAGAHSRGIHTCVETCGYGRPTHMLCVADHTDLFYFDIKETDSERHREYTGADSGLIMANLETLNRLGKEIVLRCPIIPGLNDRPDHFKAVARLANRLANVREIHPLPYHPMGAVKRTRVGMQETDEPGEFVAQTHVDEWAAALQAETDVPVVSG